MKNTPAAPRHLHHELRRRALVRSWPGLALVAGLAAGPGFPGKAAAENAYVSATTVSAPDAGTYLGQNYSIPAAGATYDLLRVGWTGAGTATQTGGTMRVNTRLDMSVIGKGIYNLDGGILEVPAITKGGTSATVNFNGGLLRLTGDFTATGVGVGFAMNTAGGRIDTNGHSVILPGVPYSGENTVGPDGGLTKTGAGTLYILNYASYNGPTTVNAGTLVFDRRFGNSDLSLVLAGRKVIAAGAELAFYSVSDQVSRGVISGAGAISKGSSVSTLTLSGDSPDFTGTTNVYEGTLVVTGYLGNSPVILNTNSVVRLEGTEYNRLGKVLTLAPGSLVNAAQPVHNAHTFFTINLNGATLQATNSVDPGFGNYVLASGPVPSAVNVTLGSQITGAQVQLHGPSVFNIAASGLLTVSDDSRLTDYGFNGTVYEAAGSLTKTGPGTLHLRGSNNYSLGTTLSEGTLQFRTPQSMPAAGAVTVASGATLAVNFGGAAEFNGNNTGAGSFRGLALGTGGQGAPVTFAPGSFLGLDTGATPNVRTLGTAIPDPAAATPLGLVKLGTGTLELTVPGTYTGGTQVQAGKLTIKSGASPGPGYLFVGAGANCTVEAGARVKVTAGSLAVQGTLINNGTIRIGTAVPLSLTNGGTFINNGILDVMTRTFVPPPGFVNNGVVLDASVIKLKTIQSPPGNVLTVTMDGYPGHTYQLQRSDAPAPEGTFTAIPGVSNQSVSETTTGTTPLTFTLSTGSLSRGFYRIAVDP